MSTNNPFWFDLPGFARSDWFDIPGYNSVYQITETGAVRSWTKLKQGALLTPSLTSANRLQLRLVAPDGTKRAWGVSQLVALTFIGPKPFEGADVCHYDDNPYNNHVSNLRYDTRSANLKDAVRNGRNHFANQTHCKNRHPLSGSNLYERPTGGRACKQCRADAAERYRGRHK